MPRNALSPAFDNAMLAMPRVAPQPNALAAPYLLRFMGGPIQPAMPERRIVPQVVRGFRYDAKRKGLETLPLSFAAPKLSNNLQALRRAIEENVPGARDLDPEFLTAMLLKEGREDFGTDMYNTNDPQSVALFERFSKDFGPEPAMFVAAIRDHSLRAKRKGIPFSQSWMPGSRYETAEQYAKSKEQFRQAVRDPKNAELYEFIRSNIED